jgi:hypothetical protein
MTLKRETMRVFGDTDGFDVRALPIVTEDANGKRVRFNGIASFSKDGIAHTYSLVDGYAYHTFSSLENGNFAQSSCIEAESVPPIHGILDAINNAKVISSVNTKQEVACAPGSNKLKLVFAGEDYILCRAADFEDGFKIIGSDLNVDVHYLEETIQIAKPNVTQEELSKCGKVDDSASITPSTINILSGSNANDWYNAILNEPEEMDLMDSTCGCKGEKKACIFVHGMGVKEELGMQDSFKYFGDPKNSLPCCSSVKFGVFNTVENSWTDENLQKKVCEVVLGMSERSNKETKSIEDTVVITHSMGNLILSGAIVNGKCSLASSSKWVSLSGPMKGSMGPDFQMDVCNGGNVGAEVLKAIVGVFGACPSSKANRNMVYQGGDQCSQTLSDQYVLAQQAHKKYATAVMCSDTYNGLASTDQLTLVLGGTILPHKSKENDGAVEFNSCRSLFDSNIFQSDFLSPFYRARVNHLDTTFRHGDGWFGRDRKPLKWLECLM